VRRRRSAGVAAAAAVLLVFEERFAAELAAIIGALRAADEAAAPRFAGRLRSHELAQGAACAAVGQRAQRRLAAVERIAVAVAEALLAADLLRRVGAPRDVGAAALVDRAAPPHLGRAAGVPLHVGQLARRVARAAVLDRVERPFAAVLVEAVAVHEARMAAHDRTRVLQAHGVGVRNVALDDRGRGFAVFGLDRSAAIDLDHSAVAQRRRDDVDPVEQPVVVGAAAAQRGDEQHGDPETHSTQ
jgi:hypothetical protein